ncbi:MAG: RNA ligase [Actinomycetota bacterium]|nr:RNA ligase [Actinomycetota bacterium]
MTPAGTRSGGVVRLEDLLDPERLEVQIKKGYIRSRRHPEYPFLIYNYTEHAQYDGAWTPETRLCRGLIVDEATQAVLARPLPKFHNFSDYGGKPLPAEASGSVLVTEKLDGSLGILYPTPHGPAIATRGSFTSPQAQHATQLLRERYEDALAPTSAPWERTHLFEIIYPANRTIVDYGATDELFHLGSIGIADGSYQEPDLRFPHVPRLGYSSLGEVLAAPDRDNAEGFVVCWPDGPFWVKVKHAEYKRLHKLLTGVNPRIIWELVSSGTGVGEILARVPDEFYDWVRATEAELVAKQAALVTESKTLAARLAAENPDRRDFARAVGNSDYEARHLLFAALDNKELESKAWKWIRPEVTDPVYAHGKEGLGF